MPLVWKKIPYLHSTALYAHKYRNILYLTRQDRTFAATSEDDFFFSADRAPSRFVCRLWVWVFGNSQPFEQLTSSTLIIAFYLCRNFFRFGKRPISPYIVSSLVTDCLLGPHTYLYTYTIYKPTQANWGRQNWTVFEVLFDVYTGGGERQEWNELHVRVMCGWLIFFFLDYFSKLN